MASVSREASLLRSCAAALAVFACAGQAPLAPGPVLSTARNIAPRPLLALTTAPPPPAAISAPVAPLGKASPEATLIAQGDIGSAGPTKLLAASTSGAWVALCDDESRSAKLVLGSGTGERIDELLAQDPTGRYVVTAHDGVAVLVDAATGLRVSLSQLGADVRRARADYAEHRTLSFDARGRYLAYLKTSGSDFLIVVRTLETGAEQILPPGVGQVFRLKLSADARYVAFDALREDTNHNGKLDWPAPEELPRKNACDSSNLPKFRSFAFQGRGDAITRAVVALETGAQRDVPQLVTPLGESLLVREADGRLQLDQAGKLSALAPASCGARVLFADAERGLVLASCAPPPPKRSANALPVSGKREVWLFGSGYAKNLQSELYETSTDREAVLGTRLVPLYPGSNASLLDLERRELLPLAAGSRVVASNGALALIWRDSELYRYDAATKTEQLLAHGVLKTPDLLQAGSAVLLSPFVIVGCESPAFSSPPRALALSSSGFILTAAPPADSQGSPQPGAAIAGPLRWVDAKVPPPDGPPR